MGPMLFRLEPLTTPNADNPEQHMTLYVNDKREDFDNNLAYTNNGSEVQYLAVDDIEIFFDQNLDQENNNGDISFTFNDNFTNAENNGYAPVYIPTITITSSTDYWPIIDNRDFTVFIPENITLIVFQVMVGIYLIMKIIN